MKKNSRTVLILCRMLGLSLFIFASSTYAGPYTLQDLEALEKNQSAREFLDHAHDIRPTHRNEHWLQMTQHMAVVFIKQLLEGKLYTDENFHFLEKINLWAVLKSDEFFQIKRDEFLFNYLSGCLKNSKDSLQCKLRFLTSWNSSRKDPDRAVHYLKLFKGLSNKEERSILAVATNSDVSAFLCRKEIVKKTLVRQMIEIAGIKSDPPHLARELNKMMNKDCWNQVRSEFEFSLVNEKHDLKIISYKILEAKDELNEADRSMFLISYLLEVPRIGRIFNQAWNELKKLGNDFTYRKRVLSKLKMQDPLPGRLFHINDARKKKVLLREINKNFPEYLDFYTKTCLDYLDGSTIFPKGNPTPNCQLIFKDKLVAPVINQGLKIRFSGLKKP